jgi:hypothetical protein
VDLPRNRRPAIARDMGTKVVVRTMEVGGKTIEYWRKVNIYATSYSPCRLGTGKCDNVTASGMQNYAMGLQQSPLAGFVTCAGNRSMFLDTAPLTIGGYRRWDSRALLDRSWL